MTLAPIAIGDGAAAFVGGVVPEGAPADAREAEVRRLLQLCGARRTPECLFELGLVGLFILGRAARGAV